MIYTVGHSTRTYEEMAELLNGVDLLVDIRSYPGSRHCPQWNREVLEGTEGYLWLPALGGRRRALKDSINGAWRNASFRGFADYMQTQAFDDGLRQLVELSKQQTLAIMCAEAVWWRCHRSMVADALVAGGNEVVHIIDKAHHQRHILRDFAVVGATVYYPSVI